MENSLNLNKLTKKNTNYVFILETLFTFIVTGYIFYLIYNKIYFNQLLSSYYLYIILIYTGIVLLPQGVVILKDYIFEKLEVNNSKEESINQFKKSFSLLINSIIMGLVINLLIYLF